MERSKFISTSGALAASTILSGFTTKPAYGASFADGLSAAQNRIRNAKSSPRSLGTESDDLTPYGGLWDDAHLRHLLRRTMFGVSESQFVAAQALGSMSAVVTDLLAAQDTTKVPIPTPFASWLDDYPDYTDAKTLTDQLNIATLENYKFVEIENWWFDQMMQENLSIRQKMTLMWGRIHLVYRFLKRSRIAGYVCTNTS